MMDKCEHCGVKGWAMYHDFKTCCDCQEHTCKACATSWDDETNMTVCKRCVAERLCA